MNTGRHVADLIEKQSTSVGALKQSFFPSASVSEGPGLESEQLALEQSVGKVAQFNSTTGLVALGLE